jgi:hypothetical protein
MAMPKSEKLQKEEAASEAAFYNRYEEAVKTTKIDPKNLAPVQCLNEFVAILPYFHTSSTIHLPGEGLKSDEGLVVGVGELVTNVKVGDAVKYSVKHITAPLVFDSGSYKDLKIVLVNHRSLYCKIEAK